MLRFECDAYTRGILSVAGVDEAGRGPLAGPLVAAAVCIDNVFIREAAQGILNGLTDSKQLSEKKRELFFLVLTNHPLIQYGVSIISPQRIDEINILQATHGAMAEALLQLPALPELALIDGRPVPGLPCPSQSIVKGDAKSLSIAAASVIAKVTRDHLLIELDQRYPDYGFARHKGYGTKAHLAALKKYGPTPQHRYSYRPVREAAGLVPPPLVQPELFPAK